MMTSLTILVTCHASLSLLQAAVVRHEYHAPLPLSPLVSAPDLSVTTWRVPPETKLSSWSVQSSQDPGCPLAGAVNVTV